MSGICAIWRKDDQATDSRGPGRHVAGLATSMAIPEPSAGGTAARLEWESPRGSIPAADFQRASVLVLACDAELYNEDEAARSRTEIDDSSTAQFVGGAL